MLSSQDLKVWLRLHLSVISVLLECLDLEQTLLNTLYLTDFSLDFTL